METMRDKENRREAQRAGAVLKALKMTFPYPTGDDKLQDGLKEHFAIFQPWSQTDIRCIVEYLKGHGLAEYEATSVSIREYWGCKITSKGIDYLRGYGETLDGVDRD